MSAGYSATAPRVKRRPFCVPRRAPLALGKGAEAVHGAVWRTAFLSGSALAGAPCQTRGKAQTASRAARPAQLTSVSDDPGPHRRASFTGGRRRWSLAAWHRGVAACARPQGRWWGARPPIASTATATWWPLKRRNRHLWTAHRVQISTPRTAERRCRRKSLRIWIGSGQDRNSARQALELGRLSFLASPTLTA